MEKIFLGLTVAAASFAGLQSYRVDALQQANTINMTELRQCGGRLSNLLEDIRRDATVDQLTDDDLRNVPDHWLLVVPE